LAASLITEFNAKSILLCQECEFASKSSRLKVAQFLLYLLAYALGAAVRISDLERLPDAVEGALRLEQEIAALSERYRFMRYAAVVGRGLNYANAFELALKLMETCYVVAERFSSADFLHGPIALVEPGFPVIAFAPPDVTWNSIGDTMEKLQGLRAEIVAITDSGNRDVAARATRVIRLPRRVNQWLTPIPYIIPAQIFAACLAAHKGLNPDHPRTLHKVTLTM
jgi:glucosamine--fructose-6-phosphate aminotransferase (isomerizing)